MRCRRLSTLLPVAALLLGTLVLADADRSATIVVSLVRSDTGKPVAGAQVMLQVDSRELRTANAEGICTFDDHPPGWVAELFVAAYGLRPVLRSADPLPDPDEDRRYVTVAWLVPGENRIEVPMAPAVPLRVKVVDEEGKPLPGRTIRVDDCIGWLEYEAVAVTGPDGTAGFGVPRGDDVHVWLEAGGVGMERDWEMLEPAEGKAVEVTLMLESPGSGLTGRIVDPDGAPIAGVVLTVAHADGDPVGNAESGADGAFSCSDLPPGGYTLVAFRPGWLPKAVPVTVERGETAKADVVLERGLSISGRIFRRDGSPAAGVGVCAGVDLPALSYQMRRPDADSRTDAEGRFVLAGLPEGSFDLYGWIGFEGGRTTDFSLLRDVKAGTKDLRLFLKRDLLRVHGRVRIAGRPPVLPFAVVAFHGDGNRLRGPVVFTAPDGAFTLSALPSGPASLVAYAPGYAPSAPVTVSLAPNANEPAVDLEITAPEAVLTIRARDQRDRALADLTLGLSLDGLPAVTGERTADLDPHGQVTFSRLPAGRAVLTIPDTGQRVTELDLAAGDRLDVAVSLVIRVVVDDPRDWAGGDGRPGLREGDVIRAVAGAAVANADEAGLAFDPSESDAPVRITVERNGKRLEFTFPPDPDRFSPWLEDEFEVESATVTPR